MAYVKHPENRLQSVAFLLDITFHSTLASNLIFASPNNSDESKYSHFINLLIE